MTLEMRLKPLALGYRRQVWPRTRHHILSMGSIEARLIVPNGQRVNPAAIACLWVAGILALLTGHR